MLLGREPMDYVPARYPTSRSSLMFSSVTGEAIHLPCAPEPDMAGVFGGNGKDWNLGGGAQMADGLRRKKAWGKKTNPYLLIKAVDIKCPLLRLKSRLFPRGRVNDTVGLPKPLLVRIP